MAMKWKLEPLVRQSNGERSTASLQELVRLKAEVAWQTVRATAAEEALQNALQRVAEMEIQSESVPILMSRIAELQTALVAEKKSSQEYRRELENERKRVAELEGNLLSGFSHNCRFPLGTPSEGVSSEHSINEYDCDSFDTVPPGTTPRSGSLHVHAELEMMRLEHASRTSQYVRAVARSAMMEKRSEKLTEIMEQQAHCIEEHEVLVQSQREELQRQEETLAKQRQEMAELETVLQQMRASLKAKQRTNCFDLFSDPQSPRVKCITEGPSISSPSTALVPRTFPSSPRTSHRKDLRIEASETTTSESSGCCVS